MAGNLTLPPTRDAYTGKDGKPTAAFFDSLSKSQRAVNTLSRIPIIPSVDDVDSIPSGAEGVLIFSDVPAPYVSRLSEPAHAGKIYRDGQWFELDRRDGVYLEDFGGKTNLLEESPYFDWSIDNTQALVDAKDYCVAKRRAIIRINSGVWRCASQPEPFPVGINLRGHGHSSSQLDGGTTLLADYNETTPTNPFLHWDGSGQQFNSTGGGAHSMTIQKGAAKTGGTLLKLTGVDDSNRPGYMSFRDLEIAGGNQGATAAYCIYHDGSNLNLPSGMGLRDVLYDNIWFNTWTEEGAVFLNATHAVIQGLTASPGVGSGNAMRFDGDSTVSTHKTTDVRAFGLVAYGTGPIVIDKVHQCVFIGRSTNWTVTGNATGCTIIPIGDNLVTLSSTTRAALAAQKTTILDYVVGQQFGTVDNGGEFMPGGRIKKWMNVTTNNVDGTYPWASALGGNDVPFTAAPTIVSLSVVSGAAYCYGVGTPTASEVYLRSSAAAATRVVAEGPY